jgi:hypothetical protein
VLEEIETMNEPIERAQEDTGKVTARQLLTVVRAGDRVYMHGAATPNRPSYSDAFVFDVSAATRGPGKVEQTTRLRVPGYVSSGNTSERKRNVSQSDGHVWMTYGEAFKPMSGFWSVCSHERLVDILELLPADAHVAIHVYLDAGTNELLVCSDVTLPNGRESGLHSDWLVLVAEYTVRGKRRERRFIVDTSTGAHNSARFGVRS